MRMLFRVVLWLCAAYGAWILLGEIGLVTATPPSAEELVDRFIRMLVEDAF